MSIKPGIPKHKKVLFSSTSAVRFGWYLFGIGAIVFLLSVPGDEWVGTANKARAYISVLLGTLVFLVPIIAGRTRWLGKRLILSDLNFVFRREISRQFPWRLQDQMRSTLSFHTCLAIKRATKQYVWDSLSLSSGDQLPDDLLSYLRARADLDAGGAAIVFLRTSLQAVLAPGVKAIMPRLLYKEEIERVNAEVRRILCTIEREYPPVKPNPISRSAYASLLSGLTGSYVLADGLQSRAGVLGKIAVRHIATWKGESAEQQPRRVSSFTSPYDRRHLSGECLVHPPESSDSFVAGDYDGRVLSFEKSRLVTESLTGEPLVLIDASESCYRTTELSGEYGCKGLATVNETAQSGYELKESNTGVRFDSKRTMMINTSLTLVSLSQRGTELVLVERGSAARHGHNILSAAAGGVFEHRRDRDQADSDAFGVPDLRASLKRETREELGLELDLKKFVPISLFAANIQGYSRESKKRVSRGQLVCTAAYMAVTDASVADIERKRHIDGDWVRGRFELDKLDTISIPNGRDEVAAHTFCESLVERIDTIDVFGLIGALYAGAYFIGVDKMDTAVRSVFERPWWYYSWFRVGSEHRLVVDPRTLNPAPYSQPHVPFPQRWSECLNEAYPGYSS